MARGLGLAGSPARPPPALQRFQYHALKPIGALLAAP
jgi:hypothetical protein